jgi:hypothetical protein
MDPIFQAIAGAITEAMKTQNGGFALFLIAIALIWMVEGIITSIANAIGVATKTAAKNSKETDKIEKP